MSATTLARTSGPRGRARSLLSTRPSWLLLVVVVIALLGFGSVHKAPPSSAQRINYLESVLKCPPCDDISIAQSDDQQAKALRQSVAKWVGEGWSNTKIENTVVSEYGSDELLQPKTNGIDILVWVIPLVAVILGGWAIAIVVLRRRNTSTDEDDLDLDELLVRAAIETGPQAMTTSNEVARSVAELSEERDYLLRSIEDLEREYAAGDVDESDYRELRSSYVTRAARTLRLLEEVGSTDAEVGEKDGQRRRWSWWSFRRFLGRRRSRRVLVIATIACFVVILAIVAASLAGVRLPGQTSSGTVTLPSGTQVREELTDAQVFASSGNLSGAISTYNTILSQVPNQPEALAYRGWLERLAGIAQRASVAVRAGDESIAQAIHYAPSYADARAFEVIVLLEDDHASAQANNEFRSFVADKPSKALLLAIGPQMALAFRNSHQVIPAVLKPYESASS